MGAPDNETVSALREELTTLSHDPSDYTNGDLLSFHRIQGNVGDAARAIISSAEWKKENPVTIADVAPFLRSPPGEKYPSGCFVCLEDMKGGVARDSTGRPIILMNGMVHGSAEEMKKNVAYALERCKLYCREEDGLLPGESCTIVELISRETGWLNGSFRFPDANHKALFDFMRGVYPASQLSTTHFCGVPRFIVSFFALCKPFMPFDMFNRLNVKSNFKHLKKDGHISPDNMLSFWDEEGKMDFDFDKYVEWRCKEEGIDNVCAIGEGRKAEASAAPPSAAELLGDNANANVIKSSQVQKQGSGKGLFGSSKWKTKFLVLQPGLLLYFDSKKVSHTNHASRLIPINSQSSVERPGSNDLVVIKSLQRDYLFKFNSEEEAEEWTNVLREECVDAE